MRRILLGILLTGLVTSCAPGSVVSSMSVVSLESVYLSEKGQQELISRVKKEIYYREIEE
jgi:hypothetical protein